MVLRYVFALPIAIIGISALSERASASADCVCIVQMAGKMGVIHQPKGDVFSTGASGFELTKGDTPLGAGARLITGSTASAMVDLGPGCRLSIGGNSDLSIKSHSGGMACVEVAKAAVVKQIDAKAKQTGKNGSDKNASGNDSKDSDKGSGKGKQQVASNHNGNHGNNHGGGSHNHGNNNPGHHSDDHGGGHGNNHGGGHGVGCGDHPMSH